MLDASADSSPVEALPQTGQNRPGSTPEPGFALPHRELGPNIRRSRTARIQDVRIDQVASWPEGSNLETASTQNTLDTLLFF